MKKLLSLLLISTAALLASCEDSNNQSMGCNCKWTHAHIAMQDKVIHDEVEKWSTANSNTLDITLKNYGKVKVSPINCLLYTAEKCPLCNK